MKIVKDKLTSSMFEDGNIYLATHKGVKMSLAIVEEWVSIYSIESENEGKGEAQEAIELLKKRYSTRKIYASAPLSPIAKHIFDKHKIKYLNN